MTVEILTQLKAEEISPFHQKLLDDCLHDIKRSRGQMSKFYDDWDRQDEIYRGERWADQDDLKQRKQGKPEKFIVANTHAQIQAFVSFLSGLFTQNATPFELKPSLDDADYGKKWEDCEAILERDCAKSSWNRVIYQYLLDTARFGIAPLSVEWVKEVVNVYVVPETPITQEANGISVTAQAPAGWQEFIKFEGNRVRNVSPYRFFPDMNFPISEFQRGNFCASEEDYTMGTLKDLQSTGAVMGVDFIKELSRNPSISGARGGESRFSFGEFPTTWSCEDGSAPVVVTKIRKKIVPKDYKFEGKSVLGEQDFPSLYDIWIANDNRIIRAQLAEEFHQEFNYAVGQYTPDMHKVLSLGLADLVYPLQDTISWFINSHITSVRRVMQNRMIINPSLVETKSYDGEGDIFMRKGVGRMDPRMAVTQLPASDVTAGHMGDASTLGGIMQMITGVNDNLQGAANPGRRSAQENRVQTAGAAGRLKMHGKLLWEMGLGRIGKLMLSNSRQSLSRDSFRRAIGGSPEDLDLRYSMFKGTPDEIICGDDFLIFDSTLSSEKGYMAQSLQELLSMVLQSNPMAAMQFTQQIDPAKIFDEMQWLRDGTPAGRFKYSPGSQPQVPPMVVGPNGQPQAQQMALPASA